MAVGSEVPLLVAVGNSDNTSEGKAVGEGQRVLRVQEIYVCAGSVQTKSSIDGTKRHVHPLFVLVYVGPRTLDLVVDVSELGAGGGSVGRRGGPLQSGRREYVVVETGDGVPASEVGAE